MENATTPMSGETDPDYVLGTSQAEHQRLKAQSESVDPFTARIFREAGIEPGMRVLDVGCGAGDVSLLVGRMVGATGQVLGVDREAASLKTARRRVGELGITNIEFVESDFRELDAEYGVFDALVGRLVLMYQVDPAEALRRTAERVRPGGVIAFHEHELSVPVIARPALPLRKQVSGWLRETLRRSGAETGMGFGLYSVFEAAGFRAPAVRAEAIIDTPVTSFSWGLMTRVMLPKIVELGVATEKEIDIDTLDERLKREIIGKGGVAVAFIAFGAWTQRPADFACGAGSQSIQVAKPVGEVALTRERKVGAADTQRIRQLVTGYQAAGALLAADELGVVELLESGSKSAEELAHATGTHASSLYRFLRALSTIDLVEEDSDGRFSLGPLAGGLRDAARMGIESYRAWVELPFSLKTGKPALPEVFGKPFYDYLWEDEARAVRFDSALAAVSRDWAPAVLGAYDFGAFGTVADIGGGRGTFLATLLEAYPTMKGVLFDMPQMVEHAGPILESAGVAERCRCVGGSFFKSVPKGSDAYTLCNLLADWDDEHATAILKSCQRAMPPHGRLLVIDRVLPPLGDPNRRAVAFLDLWFLVLEGGSIRTSDDFTRILAAAGLEVSSIITTATTFSIVEARHES